MVNIYHGCHPALFEGEPERGSKWSLFMRRSVEILPANSSSTISIFVVNPRDPFSFFFFNFLLHSFAALFLVIFKDWGLTKLTLVLLYDRPCNKYSLDEGSHAA